MSDTLESMRQRADLWFRLHQHRRALHHWVSLLGITASATTASLAHLLPDPVVNLLGVAAFIALGFLTFFRPLERARCFVEAWRRLNLEIVRFGGGEATDASLIDAYEEAERMIANCD